jgi:hypothetical protein
VLLARIRTAPPAGSSQAEAAGRAVCVQALLDAIQVTHSRERQLEAEITERLEVHADAAVFASLPKAGHGVRAAALLSELGDARSRFPDEEALAALAGVAPVTAPQAPASPSGSAGPATRSCVTPSSTSPTTPATPPMGRHGLRPGAGPHPPPPSRRVHPGPHLDPG